MILVDTLPRGQNINSDEYIQILETLQKRFRGFRPEKYC
jgi:hypothetical protein